MLPVQKEVGQRSETVRRANLSSIVRELHLRGSASRSDLAARTGLTRSTIRALIAELVAADLVLEEAPALLGTPGRPSPRVRLNPYGRTVVALEIAVDSLAVALVGLGGSIHVLIREDRPRGHFTVDEIAADLAALTARAKTPPSAFDRVIGVGVAVVGVVRRSDGFVSLAPNLGWQDVPLGDRLAGVLDLDVPISVANEADLGAIAETRRGAAVGVSDVLFLSGEVGVGGGIFVDGRQMTGVAGYAGEVGHMSLDPNGVPCHCGSIGCWETLVGANALLERAGHPRDGGREAIDAVLREASDGEAAALGALDYIGGWTGIGMSVLVNVLNPSLIVLGGNFGRMYPFIRRSMEVELEQRSLRGPRAVVRVVPASLGVDAPLLGAAELAIEPLLVDPAAWFDRPPAPIRTMR
ncbi:MAG: ROK family protein [Candidatus Limnocylindrales bacterium]